MLDTKTLQVLEFLNEHPEKDFSIYQMGQQGVAVNFETMQWLMDKNMAFRYDDEDAYLSTYGDPEYTYQINAGGRITLEEQKYFAKNEKRTNIAIGISIISLFVAIATVIVTYIK